MSLNRPTEQDIQKLFLEINQLVNQRFMLTTLAVTVFAGVTAWIIPRVAPSQDAPLGAFVFGAALLLLVILFVLFLLAHQLGVMIRTISAYLEVTEVSNWEVAWRRYRKEPYVGYTRPQSTVFLVLGVLAASMPFLLWTVFPFRLEPRAGVTLVVIVGILYVVFVAGISFGNWFNPERDARTRWKALAEQTDA